MSGVGGITIRICPGNSAAIDWSGVMPEQVTFASCMVKWKSLLILASLCLGIGRLACHHNTSQIFTSGVITYL